MKALTKRGLRYLVTVNGRCVAAFEPYILARQLCDRLRSETGDDVSLYRELLDGTMFAVAEDGSEP